MSQQTEPGLMRVEPGGLDRADVRALLEEHLRDMYATTPAESVHALDLDALRGPGITFWTVRRDDALLGCAALKELGGGDVELKSMRTAAAARGRGVAAHLLDHLIGVAAGSGQRRMLLETGAEEYFAPARRLYARHGFVERGPFGSYTDDPLSVYMERLL